MKICSSKDCLFAERPQSLDNFSKNKSSYNFWCKICCKRYRQKHKEEIKEQKKEYYKTHKEKINTRNKQYYRAHKEEAKEYSKEYRTINKVKRNVYNVQKRKEDPEFKIKWYLQTRLYKAIIRGSKSGSAVADLMMPITDFKIYLEERWCPNPDTGEMMSWKNYGAGWHIDHIIPLSAFDLTDREQLLKAVHYSNLRPMWAKQNISEGCRGMSLNKIKKT